MVGGEAQVHESGEQVVLVRKGQVNLQVCVKGPLSDEVGQSSVSQGHNIRVGVSRARNQSVPAAMKVPKA